MSEQADIAVAYLLQRIKSDPVLAYYFGYSQSLEMLTRAHALATGKQPDQFNADFQAALRTEKPRCPVGECQSQSAA